MQWLEDIDIETLVSEDETMMIVTVV